MPDPKPTTVIIFSDGGDEQEPITNEDTTGDVGCGI